MGNGVTRLNALTGSLLSSISMEERFGSVFCRRERFIKLLHLSSVGDELFKANQIVPSGLNIITPWLRLTIFIYELNN